MPINHVPVDAFTDDIDIHNTSDFVIGGTNGESNRPLKDLINNTFYLFNRLARFEGVAVLNAGYTYDVLDARKFFAFSFGGTNETFTLPDIFSVPTGTIIPIATDIQTINCLTVAIGGVNQFIRNGSIYLDKMYLHDGESLVLVAANTHWQVMSARGNFDKVGNDFISRAVRRNSLIRNGQPLSRANNARLFEFVSDYLTDDVEIVPDTLWLSDPIRYRSLFSWGDGDATNGTTFRLPDDRGLFERNLDLGRGIDTGRQDERAGGYELDEFKEHTHVFNRPRTDTLGTQYEGNRLNAGGNRGLWTGNRSTAGTTDLNDNGTYSPPGGSETRPKNTGKIPLIYY